MAIAVADVLVRLDDLLLDDKRVRWSEEERIRWINDAAGAILIRRPAARAKPVTVALAKGAQQAIPDNGVTLLDVISNIKPDGSAGRAVRRTDRQLLDDADPDWQSGRAKPEIRHFTFDDRAPKIFYVYPPAIAGTQIRLIHAELPDPVASSADTLDLQGEYMEAVVNYVAYRAKSKDSEYANAGEAAAFYGAFNDGLGGQSQSQANASPNQPNASV